MRLKALIVDDEAPARDELIFMLEASGTIQVMGECEDGDEVAEFLSKTPVDIVFLDIQMRMQDGLATAWQILKAKNPPQIIFSTGFSEYAQQAFEINAVDYIMKPYSQERINRCIAKMMDRVKTGQINKQISTLIASGTSFSLNRLVLWKDERLFVVPFSDILYAKADEKRKTTIATINGNYLSNLTLKELEEKLKLPSFLRTHKSYIANLDKVKEIVPWFNNTFVLKIEGCEKEDIPVARHYLKAFQGAMGIG